MKFYIFKVIYNIIYVLSYFQGWVERFIILVEFWSRYNKFLDKGVIMEVK